jgi:TolB protein
MYRSKLSIWRRLPLLVVFALFALPLLVGSLWGQSGIDLRARIITGQWDPYKVAVDDFKISGDTTEELVNLIADIREVINEDLDFHVFFDTVTAKEFYLNVWEIEELTPLVWYRMGAEYLVTGAVQTDDGEVAVDYSILELFQDGTSNELKRAILKAKPTAYRRLAHMVADKVVEHVAAERPFFTSRIAYISKATGHEELYICDYDGANPIRLTSDNSLNLFPCWDQEGDKLLFNSYRRDKQQLWEHEISTGKERLIANYPISSLSGETSGARFEIG